MVSARSSYHTSEDARRVKETPGPLLPRHPVSSAHVRKPLARFDTKSLRPRARRPTAEMQRSRVLCSSARRGTALTYQTTAQPMADARHAPPPFCKALHVSSDALRYYLTLPCGHHDETYSPHGRCNVLPSIAHLLSLRDASNWPCRAGRHRLRVTIQSTFQSYLEIGLQPISPLVVFNMESYHRLTYYSCT